MSQDARLFVNMAALIMWWVGTLIICFGITAFRQLVFPLLFLLWLIPLPLFVVDRVVTVLQACSAWMTRIMFVLARVPVNQDGFVLSIPGLSIEVAMECSSIRSSLMLLVTSMVLAHLFLRSVWSKIGAVLVAVPLSIAKNAIRIFVLSMLATRVDPVFLTGRLHHQRGIVFFLLGLTGVCAFIWLLQRIETKNLVT